MHLFTPALLGMVFIGCGMAQWYEEEHPLFVRGYEAGLEARSTYENTLKARNLQELLLRSEIDEALRGALSRRQSGGNKGLKRIIDIGSAIYDMYGRKLDDPMTDETKSKLEQERLKMKTATQQGQQGSSSQGSGQSQGSGKTQGGGQSGKA